MVALKTGVKLTINSFFLRGAALLSPPCRQSFATQFQQPTDEELKMTSDPKAPGADAVYLDIEEIANDPIHYQSFYARIKVLTEKGKELATTELPYLKGNWKITDIKGRTIHPDGTVIPLTVKPEDLMVAKTGDRQIGKRSSPCPASKSAASWSISYEIHYDDDVLVSNLGHPAALFCAQGALSVHAFQGLYAEGSRNRPACT